MAPALVFFVIAAAVGLAIRAVIGVRLRAETAKPGVTEDDVCQLRQANRISSIAVVASLAALAVVALLLVAR